MELILFIYFLVQVTGQTQVNPDIPADVEVINFSWSHEKNVVLQDYRRTNPTPTERRREFRREVENNNAIENRMRDLRELEDVARYEAMQSMRGDIFKYRIELRNRGSKVIKWVFLDYQIAAPSDPDNPSHREFACTLKVKPGETKKAEAYSLLPPSRIINATTAQTAPIEKLIINRLEYHDGTFWQRPGWTTPTSLPSRRTTRGPCRAI